MLITYAAVSERIFSFDRKLSSKFYQAPLSFDLNLLTVLYDVIGFGVSYQIDDSVLGLFELQPHENFHVGYAYDFITSEMARFLNGTHEIMVNYRIKLNNIHKGLACPS